MDFMPELSLSEGTNLEVVESMKLVGYQLRSDLRTCSNTDYIVGRAYKRLWIIRRLVSMGAGTKELLNVLRANVISVLLFAVPVWTTMLTKAEEDQIESVLKTGLFLIYGPHKYKSYKWALRESNMISLKDQRSRILISMYALCAHYI